jgi:hypothetical protein
VHLRHLGESSWQIVRLRREDGGEGWIVPGQVIKAKAFGRPPGENDAERLLYEVEWQLVEDPLGQSVLRPFRARFAGFRSMGGR